VIQRHSAQRIAEEQLRQGLVGAVAVGAYDPNDGSGRGVAMAAAVAAQMIGLKYSRKDETESDTSGVGYMADAGYDPRAMIAVMEILKRAGGGSSMPEFFATHPDPGNREQEIQRAIDEKFPGGVPSGLTE
jgi:predicted Zn-dependent protease